MKSKLALLKILHDNIDMMNVQYHSLRTGPMTIDSLCMLTRALRIQGKITILDEKKIDAHIHSECKGKRTTLYLWERGNVDRRFYWLKAEIKRLENKKP